MTRHQERLFADSSTDLSQRRLLADLRKKAESFAFNTIGSEAEYQLHTPDWLGDDFVLRMYDAIDLNDQLLVRGLHCLLKGQHLMRASGYVFAEDAIINLHLARESALELIRKRLSTERGSSASYEDARHFIVGSFKFGEHMVAYFQELYELWISTKHPLSRHGEMWTVPVEADDFFDQYECLVAVFRYLLVGEEKFSDSLPYV
jgi:hypothetical protein